MIDENRIFLVFRKSNVAFVFVPKTGCSTLKVMASKESDNIYEKNRPECKVFCFVRNPYSRVYASFMHYMRSDDPNQQGWKRKLKGYNEFNSFVRNRLKFLSEHDWHFKPMRYFIELCPDAEVRRFENFGSDVKEILGSVILKNEHKKPDYRQVYNDESRLIVGQLYKWDIENLGYSFNPTTGVTD